MIVWDQFRKSYVTMDKTYNLANFKNKIIKFGIIIAAICELVSIPFLSLDTSFFYGLLLGTAISILNFNMMEIMLKKALEHREGIYVFLGYLIRLVIYGAAIYTTLKISPTSALGTLIGFLTLKIAIYYLYGFKPKFSKNRVVREEPEELKPKKHWYDFQEDEDILD